MALREFQIHGMSCVNCAMHLERMLCERFGAGRAAVNFSARTAFVETDEPNGAVLAVVTEAGYSARPAEEAADPALEERREIVRAGRLFVTASFLALPVFVIGMFDLRFAGFDWVQLLLTTLILLFPGRSFYTRAWRQARGLTANMDTLVATGTGAAYIYSLYLLLARSAHHLYFESAAVIVALVLAGRFLEERARQRASGAVRALMQLQVETALLLPDAASGDDSFDSRSDTSQVREVSVRLIRAGHRILVRRGDKIAADGEVIFGKSCLDESMLTGESRPVDVAPGSRVAAGTLNLEAPIQVRVVAVGSESSLGKMIAAVRLAIGSRAPIQRFADAVSARFVPTVVVIALVTLLGWSLAGRDFSDGLLAAIAVLVVSCPCALGLATPMAILVATGRAASRGVLIKDAPSLEILHKVGVVVLDKTGTLTLGEPAVTEVVWPSPLPAQLSVEDLLQSVAELERHSAHPLARGVVRYLAERSLAGAPRFSLENLREEPGMGMAADLSVGGESLALFVGRVSDETTGRNESASAGSLVGVKLGETWVAHFRLQDSLRPEAFDAISRLRAMGVEPVMATGDSWAEANRIASLLEIRVHAELKPEEKVAVIASYRREARLVVMVGDGINDAPALAAANVGIALGSGTDVAMATAGVTLRDGSIGKIVEAIEISKATFRNIRQNLFWAFAYNVALIPVAALGKLTPMLAAGAMACSSLLVVGNALRLRAKRP
jgi:Cu+-exporting ATPase